MKMTVKKRSTTVKNEIVKIAVLVGRKEAGVNQNVILTRNLNHLKEDHPLTKKKHEMSREGRRGGRTRSPVVPDRSQKIDQRSLKINPNPMNDRGAARRLETSLAGDGPRRGPSAPTAAMTSRSIAPDLKKMFIVKLRMSKHSMDFQSIL